MPVCVSGFLKCNLEKDQIMDMNKHFASCFWMALSIQSSSVPRLSGWGWQFYTESLHHLVALLTVSSLMADTIELEWVDGDFLQLFER